MWQSWVEIEHYSVVYLLRSKGEAHTRSSDA